MPTTGVGCHWKHVRSSIKSFSAQIKYVSLPIHLGHSKNAYQTFAKKSAWLDCTHLFVLNIHLSYTNVAAG